MDADASFGTTGAAALEVGDPRRPHLGSALVAALGCGAAFVCFALATKQIRPLYTAGPWRDDPYDAVVSFTVFFVPLTVFLSLLRIPLCRKAERLPVRRVRDLLAAARLVVASVAITVGADWVAVALHAGGAVWNELTTIDVALLACMTAVAAVSVVYVARGFRMSPRVDRDQGPDWLAEIVVFLDGEAARLRIGSHASRALVEWIDTNAARVVRGHPVAIAALGALAFGASVALAHLVEEGGGPVAALLYLEVAASAMFAFVVGAGAHLGVVRNRSGPSATTRRALDAAVAGCTTVPVLLAFRGPLALRTLETVHGGILLLLSAAALVVFVLTFAVETLARTHTVRAIDR